MKATKVLLLVSWLMVNPSAISSPYRVAIWDIPEKLDPRHNQVNVHNYLLNQVYFPMFRRTEAGVLESDFLDMSRTKSVSENFTKFFFQLRADIRFSDGSIITSEHLIETLKNVHSIQESLSSIKSISSDEKGVWVELSTSDLDYFDKLTGVASTILKRESGQITPIGLGSYAVSEYSKERVVLRANKPFVGSFPVVEFIPRRRVNSKVEPLIHDWNHSYERSLPKRVTSDFVSVNAPTLQTVNIVVSHPDIGVRRKLIGCLDRDKLREAMGKAFNIEIGPVPGFLPKGCLGSKETFVAPSSQVDCAKFVADVPFILLEQEFEQIHPYLTTAGLVGLLRLKKVSEEEKIKAIFSGTPYLSPLMFDTSVSHNWSLGEASVFFETFYRNELVIGAPINGMREVVTVATQSKSRTEKLAAYRKAHRLLLDSYYVLPLGQVKVTHYFHPNIDLTSLKWADRVGGFPLISSIKVK